MPGRSRAPDKAVTVLLLPPLATPCWPGRWVLGEGRGQIWKGGGCSLQEVAHFLPGRVHVIFFATILKCVSLTCFESKCKYKCFRFRFVWSGAGQEGGRAGEKECVGVGRHHGTWFEGSAGVVLQREIRPSKDIKSIKEL